MRVRWTDKALLRLKQVHDYIALDSPVNARRFVDRLTQKAALIALQPRAGIVVKKYQRDDIRETYEEYYRIIYCIRVDRIDVLTVRHGARQLPEQLRNL
ncbi:MAG: type II toxin-antitoxin system RelE/ParE family toxin [Nevskia sp.]|nr:type II toxin-antitoxin system RelE/ParE family toxin [Nevskia sp.]